MFNEHNDNSNYNGCTLTDDVKIRFAGMGVFQCVRSTQHFGHSVYTDPMAHLFVTSTSISKFKIKLQNLI